MVNVTLDERDEAVLRRLRRGATAVGRLAESASVDPEYLRNRLPELSDNGLVQVVEDDVWEITGNGRRAIAGSPAGTMDDRIDTPETVEDAIRSFDLRPDRADAVRNAFSVLRYWGTADEHEIVDATYTETPAGFESSEAWWTGCVRDRLADLPLVEPPDSAEQPWRYVRTPTVEEPTTDGRTAPDDDVMGEASVRSSLESAALDEDEAAAVRAAFAHLAREGEASTTALRDRVYPDHEAGYDDAHEWWTDCVRDALGSLPGVEQADEADDVWRYRQDAEGSMSSEQGADVPDEPLDPDDQRRG